MSWLDFISRIISSIAWPAVVLIAVVILRKPLSRLLTDRPPNRVKVGPLDVEWTREIAEAETELNAAGTSAPLQRGGPSLVDELQVEARRAPAVAVLEANAILERELRDLLKTRARTPDSELSRRNAFGLARLAAAEKIISQEAVNAVQGISILRNLAAHGSARDITSEQALDYLVLVDNLLSTLRQ